MPEQPVSDATTSAPVPDEPVKHSAANAAAPAHRRPTARYVGRAFVRPSRGQFAVALLCLLLGFASVVQVRAHQGNQAFAGARRDDLVAMIDQLGKEQQRLTTEQAQLEQQKSDLQSSSDKQKAAQDAADTRVQTLGILAGTVAAHGPGVRLVIADPQQKFTPAMLLDAVEELRDAGAEAIELNDSIRVVASTAFTSGPDGILADGIPVRIPVQIDAIGNPATLEGGARFRGGIVSQVQAPTVGGTVSVTQLDDVEIGATVTLDPKRVAKPAK